MSFHQVFFHFLVTTNQVVPNKDHNKALDKEQKLCFLSLVRRLKCEIIKPKRESILTVTLGAKVKKNLTVNFC